MPGEESSNKQGVAPQGLKPKNDARAGRSPRARQGTVADKRQEQPLLADGEDRDTDEASLANKEFAKLMQEVKAGKSLAAPARDGSRPRTLRQSHADSARQLSAPDAGRLGNGSRSRDLSATSSTTGADADDDSSSSSAAASPASEALSANRHISGADVADMLEAAPAGPAVLKITGSTRSTPPPRGPQQKSPPPPPETKKQRQNRRKAEERKAVRAEAEAERRALLEKQLRTAREAEGRPARNGVASASRPADAASVWSKAGGVPSPPAGDAAASAHANLMDQTQMLDTFDPDNGAEHVTDGTPSAAKGAPQTTTASPAWGRGLPSEEDQLRMIQELDDAAGWNTVPKGKKGKKAMKTPDGRTTGPDTSDSEGRAEHAPKVINGSGDGNTATGASSLPIAAPQQQSSGSGSGSGSNGVSSGAGTNHLFTNGGFTTQKHPGDSEWAVL
jgi:hypothetical protein